MLEILISSSVLILVLAILRLVLRDKISARLQYALWLLVLVRLLVPVSFFHSPVSVAETAQPVTEQAEQVFRTEVAIGPVSEWNALRAINLGLIPDRSEPVGLTESDGMRQLLIWSLRDVVLFIWRCGIVVMAVWFLFVNVRLALRLKKNRTPYDAAAKLPVYIASGLPSPCLFGLFDPVIYLTEHAAEDDTRARQIIAHELTHYRHGDMIWSLLRSVCLVVWWFNPLVWLAAALSRQDCELACDEGTIKALGEDARFDYGRTLVGMAKVGARPSDLLCGATTMTTGKKSLKERVERIAKAPKMSVTVAVIVLIIAAVAVGCTFSGAKQNDIAVEPEAAMEDIPSGTASASDAATLRPGVLDIAFFDAESATNSSDIVTEQIELGEFYNFFRFMDAKSTQDVESPGFSRPVSRTTLFFFDDLAAYERDERTTGFAVWEDGWFEFFHGENGDTVFYDEDGSYLQLFEDIIDKWYSESAEAVFVSDEPLGGYDRAYWEEVDRELAGFAVSGDVEVFISPYFEFDESLPEDDISGPLTLEDYIYGTDGWKFSYDSEPIANDPAATIKVHDADGRILWIMDDAGALMIEEADGSITWVAYTSDPVDCADMIRHLLPWARGEYPAETPAPPVDEAQQERTEPILAELGLYTLSGQEPKNVDGSTDYYNELPNHPLWSKLITMEFQDYVDLVYSRWWSDEDLSEPANEEFFAYIQSSTAEVYRQTTGLSVNGHEAFSYTDTIGFVSIVWLDEQSNLIFQLYDPILHGETAATDNELIALAESVTAQ